MALARTGLAEEPPPVPVTSVSGELVLHLATGQDVVPGGIMIPASLRDDAKERIEALVAGGVVLPEKPPLDRHGRLRAQIHAADGTWLQGDLVGRGLAAMAAVGDQDPAALDQLLAIEGEARAAKVGVWAADVIGPQPATAVSAKEGEFVLVEGTVVAVGRGGEDVYLNFGQERRRDFTVRVRPEVAAVVKKAGLDLYSLEGRRIRVRGWVFDNGGPMIEIEQRADIEMLP